MLDDFEAVRALVRDLAAGSPDRVGACRYVGEDGSPVCIVGALLAKVEPGLLARIAADGLNTMEFARLVYKLALDVPSEVVEYLDLIQTEQDAGETWSVAVQEVEYDRVR